MYVCNEIIRHLCARTIRFIDGPRYRTSADGAGSGRAAQMRNAPEYFVAATYKVAAYMMQPARAPTDAITPGANEAIRRQHRRVHFHVIKERHFPGSCSCAIQPREALWAMRYAGADAEKQ